MIKSPIEIVQALDKAFNDKDIEALLSFYAEDAIVVVSQNKTIRGKTEIRAFFEEAFKHDLKAKQENTNLLETNNLALFTSKWCLMHGENTSIYYASSVFQRNQAGAWELIIDNPIGPSILAE